MLTKQLPLDEGNARVLKSRNIEKVNKPRLQKNYAMLSNKGQASHNRTMVELERALTVRLSMFHQDSMVNN